MNFTESEDKVFMTIDELCASNKNVKVSPVEQQPDKSKEMEKLIGDRLLELSRYIVSVKPDACLYFKRRFNCGACCSNQPANSLTTA